MSILEAENKENTREWMIIYLTWLNFPLLFLSLLFAVSGFSFEWDQIYPLFICMSLLGLTYYYALKDYPYAVWVNVLVVIGVMIYFFHDGMKDMLTSFTSIF